MASLSILRTSFNPFPLLQTFISGPLAELPSPEPRRASIWTANISWVILASLSSIDSSLVATWCFKSVDVRAAAICVVFWDNDQRINYVSCSALHTSSSVSLTASKDEMAWPISANSGLLSAWLRIFSHSKMSLPVWISFVKVPTRRFVLYISANFGKASSVESFPLAWANISTGIGSVWSSIWASILAEGKIYSLRTNETSILITADLSRPNRKWISYLIGIESRWREIHSQEAIAVDRVSELLSLWPSATWHGCTDLKAGAFAYWFLLWGRISDKKK